MSGSASPGSILVTGGAGYIGKVAVQLLAEDARGVDKIVATDVRETPPAERIPDVLYERLDVRDAARVSELIGAHQVDVVVHLAAIVTPPKGDARALAYAVDVDGTRNILEACVAHGVRKLILTSSGAAYGYHADNPVPLSEDDALRGNEAFAYSHHKRLVEEMLERYRREHPELEQLILRPGTVLGAGVSNQITAIFERPVIIGLRDVDSPFVFIWDEDVAAIIVEGVHGPQTGAYNLAGDGALSLGEVARRVGKPFIGVPVPLVTGALTVLHRLKLSQYGPEQVCFLQYRPVLANDKLKRDFPGLPRKSSREVFELYLSTR